MFEKILKTYKKNKGTRIAEHHLDLDLSHTPYITGVLAQTIEEPGRRDAGLTSQYSLNLITGWKSDGDYPGQPCHVELATIKLDIETVELLINILTAMRSEGMVLRRTVEFSQPTDYPAGLLEQRYIYHQNKEEPTTLRVGERLVRHIDMDDGARCSRETDGLKGTYHHVE